MTCWYCQKKGKMQKECHFQHIDMALMAEGNGKRYKSNNHINNVTDEHDDWDNEVKKYEDAQEAAVASLSLYHHLNWYTSLTHLQLRVALRPVLLMQLNICIQGS
jgi:hypothetical protein